jgi:O-antigen/teichoic acid export membrane protein
MFGIVTNALVMRMLPTAQERDAYVLALSIVSLGAVVGSLGLPKTVVRLIAENMGVDRTDRTRQAIRTVLGLGVLGTLGISLAYLLVGGVVGNLLNSPVLVALTGLMAGWIAIAVIQEITAEAFRGFHDIRLATLLGGLATGGKSGGLIMRVLLLGILALLWVRSGETSLATVMLVCIGSGSASVVVSLWLLYGKASSLDPSGGAQDEEEPVSAKEVLDDAIPFLAIALTSLVLLSADIWILGFFNEEVAVYGMASRLVTFVAMPLLVVNLVLPPIVAEMYAQGQTGRLERTLRTFSTLAGFPSLLILIVFMLLGGPILGLVYGERLFPPGSLAIHQGAIVLVLLSAAKLTAVWSGSCGMVLQFTGHQSSMLRISVLTSPLFFVVAILATQRYGPVGVACAAGATTALQNVMMVLLAKRKTGMWTQVMFSLTPFRKVLSRW